MDRANRRVLIIGLDGATFDIIDRLVEGHRLPNLASLMRDGSRAVLKSSVMPNSFPAWTSITTGVNPGKHGIFWSLVREDDPASGYRLMNSSDICAKRIWEILGEHGHPVGLFNLPTEYPPAPVNGFLVSGALAPGISGEFTYPPELKEEILELAPDFQCELEYALTRLGLLAQHLMNSIQNRERLILHLMKEKPWDFFFAVFTETDIAQHKYWAGIDPRHPDHARLRSKFGSFVFDVYERLDGALGKILEQVSPETAVFILSDHGFGPFYQAFSLPRWLMDEGYLVVKDKLRYPPARHLRDRVKAFKKARLWKANIMSTISRLKKKSGVRYLREAEAAKSKDLFRRIDWAQTRAFFTPDYGIRLSVKGREPSGTVLPGEEEARLKKEIQRKLKELRYSNGRAVFEAVLTREEAYSGPCTHRAPDLIVPINHALAPAKPETWPYTLTHPTLNGTHTPDGLFIAKGRGIRKSYRSRDIQVVDITPTILAYLDAPLTKDMDGIVALDIFEQDAQDRMRIRRRGSSLTSRQNQDRGSFSPEEQQRIEQKLRSLGYID
jgi:predicted AlkP superfamily phosphohydrolase/phosphomutase